MSRALTTRVLSWRESMDQPSSPQLDGLDSRLPGQLTAVDAVLLHPVVQAPGADAELVRGLFHLLARPDQRDRAGTELGRVGTRQSEPFSHALNSSPTVETKLGGRSHRQPNLQQSQGCVVPPKDRIHSDHSARSRRVRSAEMPPMVPSRPTAGRIGRVQQDRYRVCC